MSQLSTRLSSSLTTVKELILGLWRGPFWWLVLLVGLLLPFSAIFIFFQAVPFIAPFVYTLF